MAENGESASPSVGSMVASGQRNFRCLLSSLAKAVAFSTGSLSKNSLRSSKLSAAMQKSESDVSSAAVSVLLETIRTEEKQ